MPHASDQTLQAKGIRQLHRVQGRIGEMHEFIIDSFKGDPPEAIGIKEEHYFGTIYQ